MATGHYTIIISEAYRVIERKECSESSGGGWQTRYCNYFSTTVCLPRAVLPRRFGCSPMLGRQNRLFKNEE